MSLMFGWKFEQKLATLLQTWWEPEIHQLMDECIDKRICGRYRMNIAQTHEIERRCLLCLRIFGMHSKVTDSIGSSTSRLQAKAAMLGGRR